MTMFSERLLANKPALVNKLVEVEVLKYKALKLDASEETTGVQRAWGEGAPWSGWKVRFHRERYTGADGVVRATRLRNQEPTKPAKDSEYVRLFSAFNGMRREGAYAKWNHETKSYKSFLSNLEDERPTIVHCHIEQKYNWFYPTTSLTWSRDWSSVLDCVRIYTLQGGAEIAERHLVKNGFNFLKEVVAPPSWRNHIDTDEGKIIIFNLIFRGDGSASCASHWSWRSNAISEDYIDPPAIS